MSGSAVGQEFANALYSSSDENEEEPILEWNEWSNWAKKMGPTAAIEDLPALLVQLESSSGTTVRVQNEYRTWEPYFCKVVKFDLNAAFNTVIPPATNCPFVLDGESGGTLAPRGGADSATVTVKHISGHGSEEERWCLVVGTEEEKWCYLLLPEPSGTCE